MKLIRQVVMYLPLTVAQCHGSQPNNHVPLIRIWNLNFWFLNWQIGKLNG